MSCGEIREQLVETARARELPSDLRKIVFNHAADCVACGRHLDDQQRLTHGLSELAISAGSAPARVEQMLLARLKVSPIRRSPRAVWAWSGAVAASVAAAFLLTPAIWHTPAMWHTQQRAKTVATAHLQEEFADGFTPLPYAAELGPEEQAEMVRVQMPREALLSMGLPVSEPVTTADADEQVQADVLVGMDGTARAIRLSN